MSLIGAKEIRRKTVSEVRNVSVSFVDVLDSGELLTGTPTITATMATGSTVTIANAVVSTAVLTINGATVSAGKAIQFTISTGSSGVTYTVNIQCGTDASQTLEAEVVIDVV